MADADARIERRGSPAPEDEEWDALALAYEAARVYVADLRAGTVRRGGADDVALALQESLPESGSGAHAAIQKLVDSTDAAVRSSGPRFFHFVIGGTTPAALAADWITSAMDQNNGAWVSSPLAAQLERQSIAWLLDLFGLPSTWGGVLTSGATMANFTALACARRWVAARSGHDVDADGLSGLGPVPVFSSGYVHPSARKALALLGVGRDTTQTFARDDSGALDLAALERALGDLDGRPGIVIANAGEVNAGDFDPIAEMADLAEAHGCWLHVDGAFGLFAGCSPETSYLVSGIDRAQSVISDGHKWLNVPYDCGFAFLSDPSLLGGPFGLAAAYLPDMNEERPVFFNLSPESSRRARSLPVWATLKAYGRAGYREMVERHHRLALRVAENVDAADDLERLAEVPLNIVCFRLRPEGLSEAELDDLNRRVGDAVLEDGRVYVGTTTYRGKSAFRPAIVNWRTEESDVDLLVDVVRELGRRHLHA